MAPRWVLQWIADSFEECAMLRSGFVIISMVLPVLLQSQAPTTSSEGTAKTEAQAKADSLAALRAQKYRTSFIASGEVQTAVGKEANQSPATGSLGLLHSAPNERFRALIAVASTADTLKANSSRAFAKALLSPDISGRGKGASGSANYYLFREYGGCSRAKLQGKETIASTEYRARDAAYRLCRSDQEERESRGEALHQQVGGRVYASFSTSTWTLVDTAAKREFSSDLTVIVAGVRAVWVPINHPLDLKGNEFSFNVEAGYTFRGIAGDGSTDHEFEMATLGTTRGVFHGPELAFSIRLNRLLASATLPSLGKFGSPKLKGLTGLQPVVSFSLDAPVVNF